MRYSLLMSIAALGLIGNSAMAQDGTMKGMAGDMSVLPQVCRDALKDAKMPKMMEGMSMSGMGQAAVTDAQKASMQAMMKTHMPMMATHQIKDPDLAFNCGMIVHHQGAIDMANVEIKFGKDEASKKMAEKIISDQKAEIAEMTMRVAKMKPN